jgi:Xaa-Pro aminopeptidase
MTRIQQLALALKKITPAAQAMLVVHPPDVRYLTGFTGSNAAVIVPIARPGDAVLFTDGRYIQQSKDEVRQARVQIVEQSLMRSVCAWMQQHGIRRCFFDAEHTTVSALESMRQALASALRRSFFVPIAAPVARLRQIKDATEIRALQKAAHLGCDLFDAVLPLLEPGRTEVEIAAQLELAARRAGADGMSFDTIVASGARSALPHGRATTQRLPRRGFVVLDFGVLLGGYCSDMTRTVHLGAATAAERSAYDAVLAAQLAGLEAVRPGATCGEVDEAARSVLRRAKLAQHFTHSTGHGVGLEIHEGPRLAAGQKQVLEPGMVITVEPGIYQPKRFGIRIEDMVLVTERGGKVLTRSPKTRIEL